MYKKIVTHQDLDVYQLSVEAAMEIFELTKKFPSDEKYSLTDQIRRSSRSVSGQIGEAWRRRVYPAAFVNKLNEAESEGAETQVWLEYSMKCGYITTEISSALHNKYEIIIRKLITMQNSPEKWTLSAKKFYDKKSVIES